MSHKFFAMSASKMDENLMHFVAAKIMHANVMEIHRKNHNKSKNRNQKSPFASGLLEK